MKRIIFFLTFTSLIFSMSCSSDDLESDLIGTWELSESTVNCASLGGPITPTVNDGCLVFEGEQLCISLIFAENGTGRYITKVDGASETDNFTYQINDDLISICDGSECNNLPMVNGQLVIDQDLEGCAVKFVFSKL